jgi:uncharacterized protein YkwD
MKSFAIILSILVLAVNSNNSVTSDNVCLTAEEQKLYDMIMEYRKKNNLPPIPISEKLTRVAKAHARDLTNNYDFDPENKCNPHSWSKKGKWTSCCYTSDHKQAECMWNKPREISGYDGHGYEIAYYSTAGASAKEGLDGWKVSPGHNPLLVNSGIWEKVKWNAIGIALYKEYGLVWFGENPDPSTLIVCD